ncbi:cytoplasmic protein [Candidatus Nitrospira bockiana]
MAALAESKQRAFEKADYNELPVKGATKIYMGSAVGDTGGYARPLNAGDKFYGFALAEVDNAGADGAKRVRVMCHGRVVADVTGVVGVADLGKVVYMSSDNDFTLTEGSNTPIGRIVRHESGTRCVVEFTAPAIAFADAAAATAAALTDNTAGTANTTLQAIPDPADTPASADALRDDLVANALPAIRNNFADVAAQINALITDVAAIRTALNTAI